MTKTDYAQQRKDPRWQKKRLQIMERDEFKCVECEAKDVTLNVHHAYYVTGRKPWQYPDWSLTTLCRDCHQFAHEDKYDGREHEFPKDGCREEWESFNKWIADETSPNGSNWYMMASFAQCLQIIRRNYPEPEKKMEEILDGLLGQLACEDYHLHKK